MKRRSLSTKMLAVIAALALTLGAAAMTVFAQPSENSLQYPHQMWVETTDNSVTAYYVYSMDG